MRAVFHVRAHASLIAVVGAAAFAPAFACGGGTGGGDVHDTSAAKSKGCFECHSGAYNAATHPVHVNKMPTTCQSCHGTKGWTPAVATDHPWWPLRNKHAAASCASCHAKGFATGDTPTACEACHRKDYDQATDPNHTGFPTDCAPCHSDQGFRPSTYVHQWPLQGKHVLVRCNDCHTGSPPKYAGTTTDCYECHKAKTDASTFPNHGTFPHTCLDCHVMSGFRPAIGGLHPEAKFPLKTGKHADPAIHCQDCHVLARGASTAGQNADCVNCHMGSHPRQEMDTRHVQLNVAGYSTGSTSPNDCLICHAMGTK